MQADGNDGKGKPDGSEIRTEEVTQLIALALQMRGALLLCAPPFPFGSDGYNAVAQARDCMPFIQSLTKRLAAQEEKSKGKGASPAPDMV